MKQTLNPLIHQLLWDHNDSNIEELIQFATETGNPKFLKTLAEPTPARTFNRCLHELERKNDVRCLNPFKEKFNPNIKPILPKWHAFPVEMT